MSGLQSIIEWKDVKDELPDEDFVVLAVIQDHPDRDDYEVIPCVLDDGEWYMVNHSTPVVSGDERVVYWSDLPDFLPKKDN